MEILIYRGSYAKNITKFSWLIFVFSLIVFFSLINLGFSDPYLIITTNSTDANKTYPNVDAGGNANALERWVGYRLFTFDPDCYGSDYNNYYIKFISNIWIKNNIPVINITYDEVVITCNKSLSSYLCTTSPDGENEKCQYSSTEGAFTCTDVEFYNYIIRSPTPFIISFIIPEINYPNIDEIINYEAIHYLGSINNNCYSIQNTTIIFSPNITIQNKNTPQKSINWTLKRRIYPFVYVDDLIVFYPRVENVRDRDNNGRAFEVFRNITSSNASVISLLNQSEVMFAKSMYSGEIIPNLTTPPYHEIFIYSKALQKGKSTITINVSDYSSLYNDTMSFDVYVLDPYIEIKTPKTTYQYGESNKIFLYVYENASEVKEINLTITYETIENGKVVNKTEIFTYNGSSSDTLIYNKTIHNYENQEFYSVFNTPTKQFNSSGVYFINASVKLKEYSKILRKNKTIYTLPGKIRIIKSEPTYRMLINQTGFFNITILIGKGDMHNLKLSLNLSDVKKIIPNNHTITLGNLTNGTVINLVFNITTNKTGLLSYILNYTYTFNYTLKKGETLRKPLEVVNPKVFLHKNILNITEQNYLELRVVGNLTKIKDLNLLLNKTLFGYENLIDITDLIYTTEAVCYAEEQQTNINAYPYAINSTNVDYAENSIDNNTLTYATFKTFLGNANITYNFSKPRVFSKISIYGKAGIDGELIKIYYFDGQKYVLSKDTQNGVKLGTTLNYTNITFLNPIRTNSIIVSIEGNNVDYIHEITFYLSKIISDYLCVVYNFSLTEEVNISGKYNITYNISFYNNPTLTGKNSFFVRFGIPQIILYSVGGVGNIYLSNEEKTLQYIFIKPLYGDLYNIKVNLTINDTTYINFTPGETSEKNIRYVSYYNYYKEPLLVEYNLSTSTITNQTYTAINVTANHTINSIFTYNETGRIELIPADKEKPNVSWWDFGYGDNREIILYNRSNINYPLRIAFNASDDLAVIKANITILYPNGTKINYIDDNLLLIAGTTKNGTFIATIPKEYIKLNGTYFVNLSVIDYGGNETLSNETKNITITDKIDIRIIKYANIYNRGQSYLYNVVLANGITITNEYNLTLIMNSSSSNNTTYIECSTISNSCNHSQLDYLDPEGIRYTILLNETPQTYTVVATAEYYNNTGIKEWNYTTTDKLRSYIEYLLSSDASSIADIRVYIYHQNFYENFTTLSEGSYIECDGTKYSIDYKPEYFYPVGFTSCPVGSLIILDAKYNNNTAYKLVDTTPSSSNTAQQGVGGGGGGGGSGAGGGGFGMIPTYIYNYTNITIEKDARFTSEISSNILELKQYDEKRIILTISNIGNVDLFLNMYINTNCERCGIEPKQEKIVIEKQKSLSKNITIKVPFNQDPGEYFIKINLINDEYDITRFHNLYLKISEHNKVKIFKRLKKEFANLTNTVEEYARLGLDMSSEYLIINQVVEIERLMENAYKEGNYTLYALYLEKYKDKYEQLLQEINDKRFYAFLLKNKNNILLGLLIASISSALLYFYILPLIYIYFRIKYLRRKQKLIISSRIETEKQYFQRKIDEITFRRIMERQQEELIKARKEVERLEQELKNMTKLKIFSLMRKRQGKIQPNIQAKPKIESYNRKMSFLSKIWRKIKSVFKKKNKIELELVSMMVTEPKTPLPNPPQPSSSNNVSVKLVKTDRGNEVDST